MAMPRATAPLYLDYLRPCFRPPSPRTRLSIPRMPKLKATQHAQLILVVCVIDGLALARCSSGWDVLWDDTQGEYKYVKAVSGVFLLGITYYLTAMYEPVACTATRNPIVMHEICMFNNPSELCKQRIGSYARAFYTAVRVAAPFSGFLCQKVMLIPTCTCGPGGTQSIARVENAG
eukprot:5640578-Pleurochrysis_carterae.AAC.2